MARYKQLKYEGKEYIEASQINEILIDENLGWLIDCEIENARIEIQNSTLIWNAGLWYNGTWVYGVWRDGEWRYGVWENGVWYNGTFKNGIFKSGLIFEGRFIQGEILGGEVRGKADFFDCNLSENIIGNKQTVKENKIYKFSNFKMTESFSPISYNGKT